jgi:uridine kinase
MYETSSISEIVTILKETRIRLIGIDGIDGVGKSMLATKLSQELGYTHLNIDDYIDKNHGQYVNHVHYDAIRRQLNDEKKNPIIIEGVCLLAVFEKLQRDLDMLIYIKKVSEYGSWRDKDDCDITEGIDEFMTKKKETLQKFVEAEAHIEGKDVSNDAIFPELAEEIIRYHYGYRPHDKADIIYKRID